MLLSNDEAAIAKARFWSTQSRDSAPWYQHSEIGYNYRMSNVVAGIGRGQLLHIDEHRTLKKDIYETYQSAFANIDAIAMNPFLPCSAPNFWLSCMTIDPAKSTVTPQAVMDALAAENIESRPIWKPMHLQPVFAGRDFISLEEPSVGAEIFARGVCLPSDIKNTDTDMTRIINIMKGLF